MSKYIRTDDQEELDQRRKSDLSFSMLKVAEEASEVINEIMDYHTKPFKWDEQDLISELGDIEARIKIMKKCFEKSGYGGFKSRVKKAKIDKLKKIKDYIQKQ